MPTFAKAKEAKDEPLCLPVPGRDGLFTVYEIQPATARQLIDITTIEKVIRKTVVGLGSTIPQTEVDKLDSLTEEGYVELIIGADVFEKMCANGVGQKALLAVCLTAQAWHLHGVEQAHAVWERMMVNPEDPTTPTLAGKPAKGGQKSAGEEVDGFPEFFQTPEGQGPQAEGLTAGVGAR